MARPFIGALVTLFAAFLSRGTDAATFTVTSTLDDADADLADDRCDIGNGSCTLRAALEQSNATLGPDSIGFNLGTGLRAISPLGALPTITEAVLIDGYTQPGANVNTSPDADNATLLIELDGSSAGVGSHGLLVEADNTTIKGLVVHGFSGVGIYVIGGSGHVIQGNAGHFARFEQRK